MINIQDKPELLEIINNALSDGKIIELKNESRKKDKENIVIVEINRIVRTKKPDKSKVG